MLTFRVVLKLLAFSRPYPEQEMSTSLLHLHKIITFHTQWKSSKCCSIIACRTMTLNWMLYTRSLIYSFIHWWNNPFSSFYDVVPLKVKTHGAKLHISSFYSRFNMLFSNGEINLHLSQHECQHEKNVFAERSLNYTLGHYWVNLFNNVIRDFYFSRTHHISHFGIRKANKEE